MDAAQLPTEQAITDEHKHARERKNGMSQVEGGGINNEEDDI